MIYVIDASVCIKWFFTNESNHAQSLKILNLLVLDPEIFLVPDLFFIEVSAVATKKSGRDQEFCQNVIKTLYEFGIKTIPSNGKILTKAINHSCRLNISVYDALYLAVAESFNGRWVTADEVAIKAISRDQRLLQNVMSLGRFK